MKGIILAGGTGSRMHPLTKVTNKHLLPVYDKPMIYHTIETLSKSGVNDILIITGSENAGDFMKLLGSGSALNCKFTYKIQDEAGGIAQALSLAENFAKDEKIMVILGDNIFEDSFPDAVKKFEESDSECMVFLKEVDDPERFGCAEIKDEKIIKIVEKPGKNPNTPKDFKSNLAVTGLYLYGSSVFDAVKNLKPSWRGELEITDLNNFFVEKGTATFSIIKGFWSDAGTFDSLHRATSFVAKKNIS